MFSKTRFLQNPVLGFLAVLLLCPGLVAAENTAVTNFLYDGSGNRVARAQENGNHTYYVTPDLEVTMTAAGQTEWRRTHTLPGGTTAVAEQQAGAGEELYYVYPDYLGSSSLVTSASGSATARQTYYPYGTTRTLDGTLPLDRQYTGQVSDIPQTGLYYYNARYYHPTLGKFTQADTINDQLNRYAYVGNNPVNLTDPSGNMMSDGGGGSGGPCSYYGERGFVCNYGFDQIPEGVPEIGYTVYRLNPEIRREIQLKYIESAWAKNSYAIIGDISRVLGIFPAAVYMGSDESFLYMSDPQYVGLTKDIHMPTKGTFDRILPEGLADTMSYGTAFFHEVRHLWQDIYDPKGEFSKKIAGMAREEGLLSAPGIKLIGDTYLTRGDVGFSDFKLRPHGIDSVAGLFSVTYWTSNIEVDAIIAEVMMNPETRDDFQREYPKIWEVMLSAPGYFNFCTTCH